MTYAKSSRSSISPVAAVACSQKVNCSPHAITANNGGAHADGMLNRANSFRSRCRCSRVRSWGRSATDRASKPRVNEAQAAANAFKATGCQPTGSQRTGKVNRKCNGALTGGVKSLLAIVKTSDRLDSETHRFSVSR